MTPRHPNTHSFYHILKNIRTFFNLNTSPDTPKTGLLPSHMHRFLIQHLPLHTFTPS